MLQLIAYSPFYDMNGDGVVNASDVLTMRGDLGTTLPNVLVAQLAAGGEASGSAAQVTNAELAPVLAAAVANWTAAGIPAQDVALLHQVIAVVAELPAGWLGGTAIGGHVIYVSPDAAGFGWTTNPAISSGEDLETVLTHELGHTLGLNDLSPAAVANDLMTQTFGQRGDPPAVRAGRGGRHRTGIRRRLPVPRRQRRLPSPTALPTHLARSPPPCSPPNRPWAWIGVGSPQHTKRQAPDVAKSAIAVILNGGQTNNSALLDTAEGTPDMFGRKSDPWSDVFGDSEM